VVPVGDGAKGYSALNFQAGAGAGARVHQDMVKFVYDKGQGTGKKEEIGQVLYNRGMVHAMLTVEAVKRAQTKYGKKPLKGEEVRWGLENLAIDDKAIKALGFEGYMTPIQTTCKDHEGSRNARIQTWDGKEWKYTSDKYEADMQIIKPMIDAAAKKYAAEKKIETRDCAKELS
jgi:branched-chain amino acid transport system substrate-binding protein